MLDLYSRRVVGWAMQARADRTLATDALTMALLHRRPQPGLIHHTDQGCQYAATAYRQVLPQQWLGARKRRRGDCYDNAAPESFFCTLKNKLGHNRPLQTTSESRSQGF